MEKHTMLALSTAHLKKETADKLDNDEINDIVVYQKKNYGWFIPICDDLSNLKNKIPSELYYCMAHAVRNDADWLMFDRDVPTEENFELPIYDW